jgi:hypothetical protein
LISSTVSCSQSIGKTATEQITKAVASTTEETQTTIEKGEESTQTSLKEETTTSITTESTESTTSETESSTTTKTSIDNGAIPSNTMYSDEDLEYFFEIAFGAEYGSTTPILHKWASDIRIKINGLPTIDDTNTLNQVINELNSLMGGISLSIVSDNPNTEIYFTTMDQFPSIEPNYVPGNWGFIWTWWDSSDNINKARILISIDKPNQQERSHLIREELTQCIGLMKDSSRYQESIFYEGWTDTVSYAPIDSTIISLLYDSRLKSGMTQDQVKSALGLE